MYSMYTSIPTIKNREIFTRQKGPLLKRAAQNMRFDYKLRTIVS